MVVCGGTAGGTADRCHSPRRARRKAAIILQELVASCLCWSAGVDGVVWMVCALVRDVFDLRLIIWHRVDYGGGGQRLTAQRVSTSNARTRVVLPRQPRRNRVRMRQFFRWAWARSLPARSAASRALACCSAGASRSDHGGTEQGWRHEPAGAHSRPDLGGGHGVRRREAGGGAAPCTGGGAAYVTDPRRGEFR
jgi:hypothetical protein